MFNRECNRKSGGQSKVNQRHENNLPELIKSATHFVLIEYKAYVNSRIKHEKREMI